MLAANAMPNVTSHAVVVQMSQGHPAAGHDWQSFLLNAFPENIAKSIADAMNGVAFPDDRDVRAISVRLVDGERPGVLVRVTRQEAP